MTRDAETHTDTHNHARAHKHIHANTQSEIAELRWREIANTNIITHTLTHKRSPVGRMNMKSMRRALGRSLVRSLVRSHRSLIRFFCTARFARGLHCAHSLASELMGKILVYETRQFHTILTHYMGGGRRFAGEGLTGGDGRIWGLAWPNLFHDA